MKITTVAQAEQALRNMQRNAPENYYQDGEVTERMIISNGFGLVEVAVHASGKTTISEVDYLECWLN